MAYSLDPILETYLDQVFARYRERLLELGPNDQYAGSILETLDRIAQLNGVDGYLNGGAFGGGTEYTEDTPVSPPQDGPYVLGQRRDADTSPVSDDGDNHPFIFDDQGNLKVAVKVIPPGGASGTEYVEDTARSPGSQGPYVLGLRQDADISPVNATNDFHPFIFDDQGNLKVNVKVSVTPTDIATETTLAALLTAFNNESFAQEGTLQTLLTNFNNEDFATQTTLAALLTAFNAEDFASQTTLSAVAANVASIAGEDFATETTLANILAAIFALPLGTLATEATLSAFLTAFGAVNFATETTLVTRLADATFTSRINTLGQKTSANSTPVVLSSDQPAIPVTGAGTEYTEDTATAPPQTGPYILGLRQDTLSTSPVSADGDNHPLTFGETGGLKTQIVQVGSTPVNGFGVPVDFGNARNQVGQIRTTPTNSELEIRYTYDTRLDLYIETDVVNGTITHIPEQQGTEFTIGAASGDIYARQTRYRFPYLPNKVLRFSSAILFNTGKANLRQRFGAFDTLNGYFLQKLGTEWFFVKRSNASGSVVEDAVPRASWDDPMDGTGRSKVNLDFNNIQMIIIDQTWYGGGSGNLSFRVSNREFLAHTFSGGNFLQEPIIGQASLPIRYELENVGATSGPSTMRTYGANGTVDGGAIPIGQPYAVQSGERSSGSLSYVPLLAIRLAAIYKGQQNLYGYITDLEFNFYLDGRAADFGLFLNPTSLTAPAWTAADVESFVEFDNSATAFTGGRLVRALSLARDEVGHFRDISPEQLFGTPSDGSASDVLLLAARRTAGGGGATSSASANWREVG